MASKKVLILGAKGMLGQELVRAFSSDTQYTVAGWDYADIDVTDFTAAEEKIRAYAPEIILNAVAYNAVDACEESTEEYEKALLLNADVPKFLARVTEEMSAIFVHYSTDYVFDGKNIDGYEEDAVPRPLSRYGESKWQGEKNVLASGGKKYLIRLSKLFGRSAASETAKKSFFEKMLQASKGKTEVTVVDDELSCFTYAPDLALATKDLIEDNAPYGIYHLANENGATWYEGARELYAQAHIGVTIQPVGSDVFLRKTLRPKCSILRNTKRPPLRPYQEALKEYLKNMV